MKTLLFLATLFISVSCFSQDNGILRGDGNPNFETKTASWKIWAKIEIDGHTFLNDTCRNPITWFALPVGYEIADSLRKVKYEINRHCGLGSKCDIVHLRRIKADYNTLFDEAIKKINSKK